MSKVQVVPYDVAWPTLFEELRAGVATAVQDIAITIQHVGSTSVPGLLAKPIIDMDIVVPDEQVSDTIRALQTLGYEHRGIQGVPGREAFRARPTRASRGLARWFGQRYARQRRNFF